MPDAGSNRASLETEVLQESVRDVAARLSVTLDHGHEAKPVAFEQAWPILGRLDRKLFMDQRDARQRGLDRVDCAGLGRHLGRQLDVRRKFHRRKGSLRVLIALRQRLIESWRDLALFDNEFAAVPGTLR